MVMVIVVATVASQSIIKGVSTTLWKITIVNIVIVIASLLDNRLVSFSHYLFPTAATALIVVIDIVGLHGGSARCCT